GTDRQWEPRTAGERRSALTDQRVLLHPRPATAVAAIWWNDVAGRQLRRSWMAHWRQQTVTLATLPASLSPPARPPSCGSLPPMSELARASGAQCARAASREQHPGHGGGAAHPGYP